MNGLTRRLLKDNVFYSKMLCCWRAWLGQPAGRRLGQMGVRRFAQDVVRRFGPGMI